MDVTERFVALVNGPERAVPLDEAALLIAAHAHPDLDLAEQRARLDDLAATCPAPTLDALRAHLFGVGGFSGNVERYYDPENSFLDSVLDRRTGIPIALGVVLIEVGRRLGIPLAGVNLPGHFVVRHLGEPDVVIDPFAGVVLDQEACAERIAAAVGRRVPVDEAMLAPVGARTVLARMLANLKQLYAAADDLASLAWVLQLRAAIPGIPVGETVELATVHAARGRFDLAADAYEHAAGSVADPERATELRHDAVRARARLN